MTRAKDISKILTDADISGTLDVTGETTLATHLNLGDGDIIKLGASADLRLYHDGSNSYVQDVGTGQLRIDTNGTDVRITKTDSEYMATFNTDGAVDLYHNGSKRFETSSSGVTVTGDIANSSGNLTIDVAGQLVINSDSGQVVLQDDTVNWGNLQNSSGDFVIEALGTDKDMIFKGLDGSSVITALTLDMSAAGQANFNSNIFTGNTAEFVDGTGSTDIGIQLNPIGLVISTRNQGISGIFGRQDTDGDILQFRKNGSSIGSIGVSGSNNVFISGSVSNHAGLTFATQQVLPTTTSVANDNTVSLGNSSNRFDDIFATNGTIQTSDRNEKQDIEELSEAEQRVAVVAKGLMRKFRWKDKVTEKGDKARTHFGIIAQDLQDAFTAEGLDASRYGMFCSDTWWEKEISVDAVEAKDAVYKEVTDDEGNKTKKLVSEAVEAKDAYTYIDTKQEATEGYTEKTRLGVRYSELLAFIISAI